MERLGRGDLTVLATDNGPVPMQIAAVLTFNAAARPDPDEVAAALAGRLGNVPRLCQRLVRPPWWRGRPSWADDPAFDLSNHLCVRSADGQDLLDVAAELVCARLEEDRPLWKACLVDGCPGGDSGLVVVIHHVLADGIGGLAVLGALADDAPAAPSPRNHPAPHGPAKVRASVPRLLRRVAGVPLVARRSLAGILELGLGERPRLAARTSLNRPTGSRRRLACSGAPLAQVKAVAHAAGGTVNDVVVSVAVGALLELLHDRGEHPEALVVSVPVSARRRADLASLGNQVGVRPLRVPAVADDGARLRAVVDLRRAAAATAAPAASSAGPLGLVFRALARVGLFQRFVDHQRLVHTFVTNLRGPEQPLRIAGRQVSSVIPVAVTPGNVAVSFDVLSYAGWLGITTVVDPEVVPELERLTRSVQDGLRRLLSRADAGTSDCYAV